MTSCYIIIARDFFYFYFVFVKTYNSIAEIQSDLFDNKFTVTELTKSYIDKIESKKHLNIFLEVFEKSAVEKADLVDEKIKSKIKKR